MDSADRKLRGLDERMVLGGMPPEVREEFERLTAPGCFTAGNTALDEAIRQIEKGLERTVFAAASDVRTLGATYSKYSDIILMRRSTPNEKFSNMHAINYCIDCILPERDEAVERFVLRWNEVMERDHDALDLGTKDELPIIRTKMYALFVKEINDVCKVVKKYEGKIWVNGLPLAQFLGETKVPDKYVLDVKIFISRQKYICVLNELKEIQSTLVKNSNAHDYLISNSTGL